MPKYWRVVNNEPVERIPASGDYRPDPVGPTYPNPSRMTGAERTALGFYPETVSGTKPDERYYAVTEATSFNGSAVVVSWAPTLRSLADVRAAKKADATAAFKVARDAGVTATIGQSSVKIATTHDARIELKAITERITGSETQKGVTRSGARITFTNALAMAALTAVDDHHAFCNNREFDIHAAIDALTDAQDVVDYVITYEVP